MSETLKQVSTLWGRKRMLTWEKNFKEFAASQLLCYLQGLSQSWSVVYGTSGPGEGGGGEKGNENLTQNSYQSGKPEKSDGGGRGEGRGGRFPKKCLGDTYLHRHGLSPTPHSPPFLVFNNRHVVECESGIYYISVYIDHRFSSPAASIHKSLINWMYMRFAIRSLCRYLFGFTNSPLDITYLRFSSLPCNSLV